MGQTCAAAAVRLAQVQGEERVRGVLAYAAPFSGLMFEDADPADATETAVAFAQGVFLAELALSMGWQRPGQVAYHVDEAMGLLALGGAGGDHGKAGYLTGFVHTGYYVRLTGDLPDNLSTVFPRSSPW